MKWHPRVTGTALLCGVGDQGWLFRHFLGRQSVETSICSPRPEQLPAFQSPPAATASDRRELHVCEGFCSLGCSFEGFSNQCPKAGPEHRE